MQKVTHTCIEVLFRGHERRVSKGIFAIWVNARSKQTLYLDKIAAASLAKLTFDALLIRHNNKPWTGHINWRRRGVR